MNGYSPPCSGTTILRLEVGIKNDVSIENLLSEAVYAYIVSRIGLRTSITDADPPKPGLTRSCTAPTSLHRAPSALLVVWE